MAAAAVEVSLLHTRQHTAMHCTTMQHRPGQGSDRRCTTEETHHAPHPSLPALTRPAISKSVMSHMWMSHGTHANESCHTCEWVMSHAWMSHITQVDVSYHTCEWIRSHLLAELLTTHTRGVDQRKTHVTHVNESLHTREWVTWHMWTSYITRMNKWCHG